MAKTSAARHIWLAMSTIIVKPQRRMRMNQKADLIAVEAGGACGPAPGRP